jgi:hypothetical protein
MSSQLVSSGDKRLLPVIPGAGERIKSIPEGAVIATPMLRQHSAAAIHRHAFPLTAALVDKTGGTGGMTVVGVQAIS